MAIARAIEAQRPGSPRPLKATRWRADCEAVGMTIVCATHFTATSFAAVKVAAELARRHRQPLWLVTVLTDASTSTVPDERDLTARDALLLEAAALSSAQLDVRTAVLRGAVDRAMAAFCAEKKAKLLVVGDTAATINPVLVGTLDKLIDGVDVPLLVVRDAAPFDAWARGAGPLKVLLAIDHSFSSAVARDWIARLAEYGALDLVAAYVWWPAEEYERRGRAAPADDEAHVALSATLQAETAAALAGLPANVKHRVLLEMGKGHVGEQLLAIAEREQANVFVVGIHADHKPLGKLRSVAHDVLANALMSVVCIPGGAALPATLPAERPTAPMRPV